ncbi:hypothetical protein LCGC14_1041110 [marine sediment metagenome]|uniref:Uncharacterized protein n=1 Tax=marine sediment metagenome TaxID=412755 RepID=A0A0F9QXU5_9ZZZZ
MKRKHNTRSIKAIQDREAQRIDTRRRLEKALGHTPTQGTGWKLTPYQENMLTPGYAMHIARDRK